MGIHLSLFFFCVGSELRRFLPRVINLKGKTPDYAWSVRTGRKSCENHPDGLAKTSPMGRADRPDFVTYAARVPFLAGNAEKQS